MTQPYDSWTFEVSWSTGPDDTPSYEDMTSRVLGAVAERRGRTQERADINPGNLVVTQDNHDEELTAGNPLSSTDVSLGKRCRLTETVDATTHTRFTGFLNDIDPDVWVDSGDRAVTLTFADRQDRLQRDRRFRSTLGAHILAADRDAGANLAGYWSLDDSGPPFRARGGAQPDLGVAGALFGRTMPLASANSEDWLRFGGQSGPPGEDVSFATWTPTHEGSGYAVASADIDISLDTQTIAIAVWVRTPETVAHPSTVGWNIVELLDGTTVRARVGESSGAQTLFGTARDADVDTANVVVTSTRASPDNWHLVTLRYSLPSGVVTLWKDLGETSKNTLSGTPSSTVSFDNILVGRAMPGAIAHLQIYVGDTDVFAYADHAEQFRQGCRALSGQYTGERIATIAGYAGLAAVDIDTGTTVMGPAQLAGQTPWDAMADAARSEGGDLFMAGDDTLTFRARTRRHNQAPTPIAHATVSDGLRPRVDGPIVNSMEVTRAEGGEAVAEDATSIDAIGVHAPPALDISTIDEHEPADRAAWTVYHLAGPRTRVPTLPIDLLHQSEVVRDAVLGLDVGHRGDLTGMPASYPAGADKLVVEGYEGLIGESVRRIDFVTSPVLGQPAGTAEEFFELDDATLGELDAANKLAH